MQRNRSFWMKIFGLVMLLALVLPLGAALAQEEVEPIVLPEVDPLSVTGDIAIAGSSTVEPITKAMVQRFQDDGYMGLITVDETGTTGGFKRFCQEGSTDISNASRPVKDAEMADCATLGREVVGFLVGIDAITIAVSKDSFVEELTRSQMIDIFTGAVTKWNEVNPEWPAEDIKLYTPGTDSGTFGFFGEAVLGTKGMYAEEGARTEALLAPKPTTSENDNQLVEGIMDDVNAIGYFGFAYYVENEETLRAVAVANDVTNDDDGNLVVIPAEEWEAEGITYVTPSFDTAKSGEYLLARPLFIYSAKSIMLEKPQVAAFINYYLMNASEVVPEVGYFPLDEASLNEAKQLWLDVMGE